MTTLEVHGARIGGVCWWGETGVGWRGPHHCWKCYLFTVFDVEWPTRTPLTRVGR